MTLKIVVIDDESRALSLMIDYISKVPSLNLVASFQDAIKALEYLNQNTIDLILLDIQMPDITGLELIESLQYKPMVIFTTAYPEFAVNGFQLDAIDYLVKPILFPRFLKAINKAIKQSQLISHNPHKIVNNKQLQNSLESPPTEPGYIFVRVDSRWERIQLAHITFIESSGDYIIIHQVDSKSLICLQTLTQMNTRLDGKGFIRVHRSYLVNLAKVDTVDKDHLLIGETDISIGKSYRKELLKLVSERN